MGGWLIEWAWGHWEQIVPAGGAPKRMWPLRTRVRIWPWNAIITIGDKVAYGWRGQRRSFGDAKVHP